ncbi:hypothetical protein BBK14_25555 [Parafrankia soli]|uniref:Putative Flp pilus-assembly TadG-like N-terminal domain-containing protein n=1 Tax=Parafrankia soli TaxID=2599596 RepID=A0A1S1PN45_9ACTN|nr:hypothetical protein BBK14_25555 [Parafrankia soli]
MNRLPPPARRLSRLLLGEARADRGSATIWLLGALSVIVLVGSATLGLMVAGAARQRAAAAADLAALAAASDRSAQPEAACRRAAATASANAGRLSRCQVESDSIRIDVEADLPGPLRVLGPARSWARAGPWEGGPGAYQPTAVEGVSPTRSLDGQGVRTPTDRAVRTPTGQGVRTPTGGVGDPHSGTAPDAPETGPGAVGAPGTVSAACASRFLRRRSETRATTRSPGCAVGTGRAGAAGEPVVAARSARADRRPADRPDPGAGAVAFARPPPAWPTGTVTAAPCWVGAPAARPSPGWPSPVPRRPIRSGPVSAAAAAAWRLDWERTTGSGAVVGTEPVCAGIAGVGTADRREGAVPATPPGMTAPGPPAGTGAGPERGATPTGVGPAVAADLVVAADPAVGADAVVGAEAVVGAVGAECRGAGVGTARVMAARSRARWRSSRRRCLSRAKPCSVICVPATTNTPVASPRTNSPQTSKESD